MALGVELLGFQSLAAEGRRGRPRGAIEDPPVPERFRNGDANSEPPPINALRRLQRVGEVTRTCGPGSTGMGEGVGYGGWKLGEGIRGLDVGGRCWVMVD